MPHSAFLRCPLFTRSITVLSFFFKHTIWFVCLRPQDAHVQDSRAEPHPARPSHRVNSLTAQRTRAFLRMECDNNNGLDVAGVQALDNKLCSELCLPGEWQSAERERGGRRSPPRTPAVTPGCPPPAPAAPAEAGAVLRCWKLLLKGGVRPRENIGPGGGSSSPSASHRPRLPDGPLHRDLADPVAGGLACGPHRQCGRRPRLLGRKAGASML